MTKILLNTITKILSDAGCNLWYLFGSQADGTDTEGSDIDIGVTGLAPELFCKIHSRLERASGKSVDLVDFDNQKELFELLNGLGELRRYG